MQPAFSIRTAGRRHLGTYLGLTGDYDKDKNALKSVNNVSDVPNLSWTVDGP